MIIITGTGRNGTSFVAECFRNIGVDTGGEWWDKSNDGWEDRLFYSINIEMQKAGISFPGCKEAEELAKGVWGGRMKGVAATRQVVKNPDAATVLEVWIHAGVVDRVIMPTRPMDQVLRSLEVWEKPTSQHDKTRLLASEGMVYESCMTHGIPLVSFRFPDVVQRQGRDFWTLVSELTKFDISVEEAVNAVVKAQRPESQKVEV